MTTSYQGGEMDDLETMDRAVLIDELRKARTTKPAAKPLGSTEVARLLLERFAAGAASEHSSVRLARNAKGDTQIEVTVRTGESDDVRTVEDAAAKARAVYETLAGFYPMAAPDA